MIFPYWFRGFLLNGVVAVFAGGRSKSVVKLEEKQIEFVGEKEVKV